MIPSIYRQALAFVELVEFINVMITSSTVLLRVEVGSKKYENRYLGLAQYKEKIKKMR